MTITVTPVNDAPTFTKGADESVSENAAAQTVTNWIIAKSAGPANESAQTLDFIVSNNNNALFSAQPAVSPTGTLTYTPATNANGSATVTIQIHDSGGTGGGGVNTSVAQTFTINVTTVDQAPTFNGGGNDTTPEDSGPQTMPAWATAIDAGAPNESGQILTFTTSNTNPTLFSGQPAVDPISGDLTYTPAANANGSATVSVTLHDNGSTAGGGVNVSPAQTMTITVTPVNDAPTFTKGADESVSENAAAQTVTNWIIAKSAGPANESAQTLDFIVSNNNNALFSAQPVVSPTGTLTYTPATNANGSATVTIQIHDSGGTTGGGVNTSVAQTFTINVTTVDQAPTFNGGGNDTTPEDSGPQTMPAWATAIDAGAPNESGQILTFTTSNTNPTLFSGQPAVDPISGDLTYTPAANANGSATVSVTLHDNGSTAGGGVNVSPAQTMTITVTPVNDAPTFTKGADESVSENAAAQTVTNWIIAKSAGRPTESAQTLDFIVSNNNNALFSAQPAVSPTGTLTYTPATNANGSATATIQIHDSGGTTDGGVNTSAVQTFTINVTTVDQAPTFNGGGNDTTPEDSGPQTMPAWATAIDAGAPNESGQILTFTTSNTNPTLFSGQPAVDPISGDLTYTPATNANGSATVSVTLHDNGSTAGGGVNVSPAQTMTITVTPVNDAPTFTDPADQTVLEDAGAQVAVGLALPISPGAPNEVGQLLTFAMSNTNSALFTVGGQPTLNPTTGNLTYTPALNANGSAVVTARLNDNGGILNSGVDHTIHTFTINVTAVNDAPTFTKGADQTRAETGAPAPQSVPGWATSSPGPANESSQIVHFKIVSNDHPGLFGAQPAINASGNLTYTLAANRNGVANISVTVQDNGGIANGGIDTSTVQTFKITVTGVDHPPAAINDFPIVVQGSGPVAINVLANDIDPDGDPMTITSVSQGTSGHVAIAADHKSLTYDPNGSFIGTDQFVYTVSDGRGGLAFGTVRVSVVKDTFAPVATTAVAWILGGSINTTASIALTWHGTDVGFGVKTYQLQESRNNAAWAFVTLAVGASSTHRVVTIGSYYQYRIRAIDLVGNVGPWTYLHFTPTLYQQSAATYSGAWTSLRMVGALGGRVEYATTHGPVAVFTCTCRSMSWIGPKGALGSARVYIDGVLQGIFSEHSATTLAHQGIFAKTWGGAPALHEMVISAKGDGKLYIDAFLTLQ